MAPALVQRMLYRIRKSKFLKFGLPMICFVVIGSFGLAEFTAIKVKRRDEKTRMLTAEEMLQFQKKVSLNSVSVAYTTLTFCKRKCQGHLY